jgi:hypothetical protein
MRCGSQVASNGNAKKLVGLLPERTDLLQSRYGIDRIFSRTHNVKQQKASHNTEVFVKAFHVADFISHLSLSNSDAQ